MIIGFIKVGLMIGLSSIGGLIYQTLKNSQVQGCEVEEVIRDKHIKLLINHKNERVHVIENTRSINDYSLEDENDINKKY